MNGFDDLYLGRWKRTVRVQLEICRVLTKESWSYASSAHGRELWKRQFYARVRWKRYDDFNSQSSSRLFTLSFLSKQCNKKKNESSKRNMTETMERKCEGLGLAPISRRTWTMISTTMMLSTRLVLSILSSDGESFVSAKLFHLWFPFCAIDSYTASQMSCRWWWKKTTELYILFTFTSTCLLRVFIVILRRKYCAKGVWANYTYKSKLRKKPRMQSDSRAQF